MTQELVDANEHKHLVMQGQEVFRNAVTRMTESIEHLIEECDAKIRPGEHAECRRRARERPP